MIRVKSIKRQKVFIYMGSCVRGGGGSVVEVNHNLSWIEILVELFIIR